MIKAQLSMLIMHLLLPTASRKQMAMGMEHPAGEHFVTRTARDLNELINTRSAILLRNRQRVYLRTTHTAQHRLHQTVVARPGTSLTCLSSLQISSTLIHLTTLSAQRKLRQLASFRRQVPVHARQNPSKHLLILSQMICLPRRRLRARNHIRAAQTVP